jgi:flagellar basal body-associated protein FliL
VLELLSERTAEDLVTAEGKSGLKLAIAAGAGEILRGTQVTDVLFTEFVVQF